VTDERQSAGPSAEHQKRALLDAAHAAVADAHAKAALPKRRDAIRVFRTVMIAGSLVVTGFGVYLLAARPAWFITPPPPAPPVEVQEASLRLTLVREANRVREFRDKNGRLPATLSETGSPVAGLGYERRGDSLFVLRAPFGAGTVEFLSTDSVSTFLGRSLGVIAVRSRS
jgi:hypothetical protein